MSDDPFHDRPPPLHLLLGASSLAVLALVATATVTATGVGRLTGPEATAYQTASLRFEDRTGGAVAVLDGKSGTKITQLAPGTDNFVRHVMRGLARERRQHGIGAGPPFNVIRWSDGRLTLEDTATGRRIALEAFGPDNAGAFARFLAIAPTATKQHAAVK